MKIPKNKHLREYAIPAAIFLAVTIILTVNILSLPYSVIGDSFAWSKQNLVDILGPRTVRESYMGDIALLSTFKSGFLFPLSYLLSSINLPMTIVYPFMFYFLAMAAFYAFSGEFLKNKAFRIAVSIAYIVNPVTPYYYISILSPFILVFLPLALKFFVRTIRQTKQLSGNSTIFLGNFALCALFLGLTISAHEQFLPSAAILVFFLTVTFIVETYRTLRLTARFGKIVLVNVSGLGGIVLLVNSQEILSLINVSNASFASYFTGRFYDFVTNVRYTYSTANIETLARLGGDSGAGLMQNSWFDSSALTNLFGYAIFLTLICAVVLLWSNRRSIHPDKIFFLLSTLLFVSVFSLILFIKYLPENTVLAEKIFSQLSLPMQSFETPAKLRVLLLLSGLTVSLFAFQKLETFSRTRKRKIFAASLLCLFVLSTVIYNSPWVIGDFGYTPVKQISESLNWGDLYNARYSNLSSFLEKNYADERGMVLPYTHKVELYVPPQFRLLQLFSSVNDNLAKLTQDSSISLSKLLGLLSAKYVVVKDDYLSDELLLFPKVLDNNVTQDLKDIANDDSMMRLVQGDNWTVYENKNALPKAYATNYYVLYDEPESLEYTFESVKFENLPVFIESSNNTGELTVPSYTKEAAYEIYAVGQPGISDNSLELHVINGVNQKFINLTKIGSDNTHNLFSTATNLLSGDKIHAENSNIWIQETEINELTLNSSSYNLGSYGSFMLNFTVNQLQRDALSFHSPRVIIDNGDSKYFLIFQTGGFVELATLKNGTFTSGAIVNYGGYDLTNPQNYINVAIIKNLNHLDVSIGKNRVLSFPVESTNSTVSISSEHSTSKFIDISLSAQKTIRLFAVRQAPNQQDFTLKYSSSEKSVIEIQNATSEYAVVAQYLNNPARKIEPQVQAASFQANLFFNGWIITPENNSNPDTTLTVELENSQLTYGLFAFSTAFTFSAIIIATIHLKTKRTMNFSPLTTRLKKLVKRGKQKQ